MIETGMNRKRRAAAAVMLVVLTALWIFPLTAHADTGPKPSVTVRLDNLPSGECWGTLLSASRSTGPARSWDEGEEKEDSMNPDLWPVFQGYDDPDGFYFLQWMWRVDEKGALEWVYYPPSTFKLLLYFPETGSFVVSQTCERYAFDSGFTVDLSGVTPTPGAAVSVELVRHYEYGHEVLGFCVRVLLTLAIEIGLALLFRYTERKPLLIIIGANVATQVLLNLAVQIAHFADGSRHYLPWYILCELLVTAAEAVVYALTLNRVSEKKKRAWIAPVYAVVANIASLVIGIRLAEVWPEVF